MMKSTNNSKNKVYFTEYYDLMDKEWVKAICLSIDTSIDLIYYKELTLSEIQQYLPDGHPDKISKQFVLPERWHVVVTKDNQDILSKWRGVKLDIGYITGIADERGKPEHNPRYRLKGETFDFGVEITLDQFKKYVLKKEEEKVMYIKCTNSGKSYITHPQAKGYGCINYTGKPLKKGKIYKVIKYIEINPEQFGYSCAYGDEHYLIGETGIIVSTKEEYENQFKIKENIKEEFKIGEWIAATNKSYVSYDKIVQVKNIDGDRIYVSPDGWWERKDVRKVLPHEIPHQDEYICKADPVHTSDDPKSLLDREEIEVTIKKTAPKQFNIF